jgi:uncharacterized repeat protein (TIGR01451 family)
MGTGDIRNVTVIDTMPPGWKYLNYTNTTIANWNLNPPAGMVVNGSNATGSIGNNYVNFTNISLSGSLTNGGDVRLIRYTAYINDNVTEGINWNCVNATGLDGNNTLYTAAANHCIPMNMHKPLLEITKSVSQHDVEPGSEPVVTIIIENPTYAPVYNVTITDFMPRGFNYTSGSAKLDGRAISDPNITGIEDFACGELVDGQLNLTWNLTYDSALSVIPPKTTVVLTFKTHVKCNVQAGNFNNTANVSGVTGAGAAVGPNSTFFEMKGYLANATLTKYASNNAPTYFEYVDYTIVIWNNPAGANIAPLTLADVMPPYLKYVPGYTYVGDLKLEPAVCGDYTDKTTASPITNVRNDSSGVNCTGFNGTLMDAAGNKFNATETQGDGTGQVLLWNLSKWLFLTPGQQVSIKYRTQVIPGIKGTARNNVTLSYLDPEHPDLCLDCLFDISGSSIVGIIGSPPVESEATYTLNLNKGWNLISIPVKPTDTSISAVLAPIAGKYTDVAAWNGNWEYLSYAYGDWFGNLAVIEPKKGYWLYMNEPAELKVTGTTDYDRSTTLYYGWNLIGSTSTQPVALNTALASIEGRYIDVATWNNGQWVYRSYAYGDWFGDLNTFEPGKGYWLNIAKGNSKLV